MPGRYDHPNFITRREFGIDTVAGAATVGARFARFQKHKLKAVHVRVIAAGTSAGAGNALIVRHGTTAIGTFTLGTTTVGATQSIVMNREVSSLELVDGTNGTDATGRVHVIYEHEMLWDGTPTA